MISFSRGVELPTHRVHKVRAWPVTLSGSHTCRRINTLNYSCQVQMIVSTFGHSKISRIRHWYRHEIGPDSDAISLMSDMSSTSAWTILSVTSFSGGSGNCNNAACSCTGYIIVMNDFRSHYSRSSRSLGDWRVKKEWYSFPCYHSSFYHPVYDDYPHTRFYSSCSRVLLCLHYDPPHLVIGQCVTECVLP